MTEKEIQEKASAIAKEHEKYREDCRIHLHHEGKSEVDVAMETAYAAAIEMAEWILTEIAEGLTSLLKEGGEKK